MSTFHLDARGERDRRKAFWAQKAQDHAEGEARYAARQEQVLLDQKATVSAWFARYHAAQGYSA